MALLLLLAGPIIKQQLQTPLQESTCILNMGQTARLQKFMTTRKEKLYSHILMIIS